MGHCEQEALLQGRLASAVGLFHHMLSLCEAWLTNRGDN